ncbi:hypothetical protein NE235_10820 [Actinoallomurus spadix]|uniref:Uncharacterized protein n=1 Tax=Actinoallomurus spadix TaxID=79912 RepID=A0ABP3GL94_9ACTN|nr:hypothetical protein [Actinoallomurus spadix]MCO5986595.1 hypothetical protein [Actinoallomurus spadix]
MKTADQLAVARLQRQLKAQETIAETLMAAWLDLDEVRRQYALLSARQDREEMPERHLRLVRSE